MLHNKSAYNCTVLCVCLHIYIVITIPSETVSEIINRHSKWYIFHEYNLYLKNESLPDEDKKEEEKPISADAPLTGIYKSLWDT